MKSFPHVQGSSGAVLTARALECLGSKRTVSLRSLAKSHSTYDPETDSEISFNAYTPPDEEVFGWWPVSVGVTGGFKGVMN